MKYKKLKLAVAFAFLTVLSFFSPNISRSVLPPIGIDIINQSSVLSSIEKYYLKQGWQRQYISHTWRLEYNTSQKPKIKIVNQKQNTVLHCGKIEDSETKSIFPDSHWEIETVNNITRAIRKETGSIFIVHYFFGSNKENYLCGFNSSDAVDFDETEFLNAISRLSF